jgi:hypothetical protein
MCACTHQHMQAQLQTVLAHSAAPQSTPSPQMQTVVGNQHPVVVLSCKSQAMMVTGQQGTWAAPEAAGLSQWCRRRSNLGKELCINFIQQHCGLASSSSQ